MSIIAVEAPDRTVTTVTSARREKARPEVRAQIAEVKAAGIVEALTSAI
jgi:hypothetical protein